MALRLLESIDKMVEKELPKAVCKNLHKVFRKSPLAKDSVAQVAKLMGRRGINGKFHSGKRVKSRCLSVLPKDKHCSFVF